MKIQRVATLALIGILAAPMAPPAVAGIASARVAAARDVTTPVMIEKEGVKVATYRFDRLLRASAGGFKGKQAPSVKLAVENGAQGERAFSVAVAIFDRDGGLLAAGSAEKERFKPGEKGDILVPFEGVNQNLARAEWVYVALETHLE